VTCDSTTFDAFHFFKDDNVFCSWNVNTNVRDRDVNCVNGRTGAKVRMPGSRRVKRFDDGQPLMANYSNLLHVSHPNLPVELDSDSGLDLGIDLDASMGFESDIDIDFGSDVDQDVDITGGFASPAAAGGLSS